jgi:glycosyltransferase involved in cell wall biosynthesis
MRLLQIFNRYLHPGGEEKSVDRIYQHLSAEHDMRRCLFDSREWKAAGGPSLMGQAARLFYNPSSRDRVLEAIHAQQSQALLVHNLYPVASPAVFHAAQKAQLPIIHFLHNFRPFCVSGTLYSRGRLLPEALHGHWYREVAEGTWQGSVLKSALFAVMLKLLHRSGWLNQVQAWISISAFMRQRLVAAGVPAQRIHTLRHSWDALPQPPSTQDGSYYLFLARLVEEKGVHMLLEAWAELRNQLGPRTPELHIAGEGPLQNLVQEHSTQNPSVKYLGLIDGQAKTQVLSQCRALLVPSTWWEPLGIVVYEAYDHARPVIAARSGGLSETVQHQKTGLLHEPGSVSSLVQAVLELEAHTSGQRATMGAAGREWLLRETAVHQWQQRFNQILATVQIRQDTALP